jgi:hypothetical protein
MDDFLGFVEFPIKVKPLFFSSLFAGGNRGEIHPPQKIPNSPPPPNLKIAKFWGSISLQNGGMNLLNTIIIIKLVSGN